VLLEEGHAGDDTGFAAGGERVQLELGGDEGGGELGVGGGTGTSTPNLGGDVVKLLTILVGDDGAGGGSSIGSNLLVCWSEAFIIVFSASALGSFDIRERGRGDMQRNDGE
jgi:hypothetical protein